jgi:acyl carrier protein
MNAHATKQKVNIMNSICTRLKNIIAETTGMAVGQLTRETNLATDLEGDDLLVVELSIAFAKEFQIAITDLDIEAIQTLGDVERLIQDRVGQ